MRLPPKEKFSTGGNLELLKKVQDETKLRITTTYVILWNFEEETAHAISEMILSYDSNEFAQCLQRAAVVTKFSEDIFQAVNKLLKAGFEHKSRVLKEEEDKLQCASDFLCAAIDKAFNFVSTTAASQTDFEPRLSRSFSEPASQNTTDFINYSMTIAHSFKELIGLIIAIAYRMVCLIVMAVAVRLLTLYSPS